MNRRDFLQVTSTGLATAGLFSWIGCRRLNPSSLSFGGSILGASVSLGHRLFQNQIPAPSRERKVPVVIVGGGIAGLSAGWKLQKSGFQDFEILELESHAGGVAQSGRNSVSAYPWGAHYLPIPTRESKAVRELLEELGAITGYTPSGVPIYKETFLCFSPQERLYIHGKWQEGLLPLVGATQKDLDQYQRFKELVQKFKGKRGKDGRKYFALPMEMSSRDPDARQFDQMSMQDLLHQQGLDSVPLHWYVNYGCRDDFGSDYREVSAWAGLHYYCSRDGEGEDLDDSALLTWPEGNGWLVNQLAQRLRKKIVCEALVYHMANQAGRVRLEIFYPRENRAESLWAEDVIYAAPRTFARFLGEEIEGSILSEFQYAPWLVANLTLRSFPQERAGFPLCWDNVIYDSPTLGYVVASHQSLRTYQDETVLTFYHALSDDPPNEARRRLLQTDWNGWSDFIIKDLSRPHPELPSLITRIDMFRWGHAMVKPRTGFLWGEARRRAGDSRGNIHFAHSDLSGFSLFEEAQYRGLLAAEKVMTKHRLHFTSSLDS
jgi:hypothetical protein